MNKFCFRCFILLAQVNGNKNYEIEADSLNKKWWNVFFTQQFIRFLLVGGGAAFVNWCSYILITHGVGISHYTLSISAAYAVGMCVAFILNSLFVFPNATQPLYYQIRIFVLTNIGAFLVVWIFTNFFRIILNYIGVPYSDIVAYGLSLGVPMFLSFIIYKFIGFKDTL